MHFRNVRWKVWGRRRRARELLVWAVMLALLLGREVAGEEAREYIN